MPQHKLIRATRSLLGYPDHVLVGVINCGIGNSASIVRMYESLGIYSEQVCKPTEIPAFSHIILPGVGHFGFAVDLLRSAGWPEAIQHHVCELSKPLLGICLGAQLLGRSSEEGPAEGLGLLPFETVRMDTQLPIPHMGWKHVEYTNSFMRDNPLFNGERYYFSHGYEMKSDSSDSVLATFSYDGCRVAAIGSGSILGVQFHPEKSHRYGKKLLKWFTCM